MNVKNTVKLTLDVIMLLIVALLYEKRVISMSFHEIVGLGVFFLFLIHLVFNQRWIKHVSKRILDKNLPTKTKLGYVINALLVISWALVGISGVLISKVVFHINVGGMLWKTVHYTSAAVSLILLGIHLGLHGTWLKGIVSKGTLWMKQAAKPIGMVCLTASLLFGVYSIKTTNIMQWLTMPIVSMVQLGEQGDFSNGHSYGAKGFSQNNPTEKGERKKFGESRDMPTPKSETNAGSVGFEFKLGNVIKVVCSYGSIMILIATIVYGIEMFIKRKRLIR